MDGVLNFCYKPLLHLSSTTYSIPANASFKVWYNGDFGPCFEYLVLVAALSALFGLASGLYAGLKHTTLKRKRRPPLLLARAVVSLCVVVSTLVELIAAFWIATERPLAVLVSEITIVISWSVHLFFLVVLSSSIAHSGRGPLMLNSLWFLTLVGTVFRFRTVVRWNAHPSDYRYFTLLDGDAYFSLLLRVITYVHFGLQCIYAITLVFKVKPVTGDNIRVPVSRLRKEKINSGLTQYNDREEDQLITSDWKAGGSSSKYGSIRTPVSSSEIAIRRRTVDASKLEASEDKANVLSLLSFWWVQPLMERGALGLLEKPEDLPQLPRSLKTATVRERFQSDMEKYRHPQPQSQTSLSKAAPSILVSGAHPPEHEQSAQGKGHLYSVSERCDSRSSNVVGAEGQYAEATGGVAGGVTDSSTLLQSFTHSVKEKSPKAPGDPAGTRPDDSSPSSSIVWSLNRVFGWHYYPLGLLKLTADILGFAGPLLLHALVAFMENRKEPISHGYYYALGLFLSTLLTAILNAHFNYQVTKVGLKIRAALITEVYRKALSVNSATLSQFSTGQVVNYMSTDTDRIVNFCQSFHQFWSLPFQIAVALYLLHQQVGLAFLTGLGFCLLLIPINRWLAVKIGKLSTKMMDSKDQRVKLMSEILTGIRVIKFYAWENSFAKKILRLRTAELKSLKGRKYLDALCVYFWATTPVLISILTFATYVAIGNTLTAAKVFTSVALFSILISPLNAFPWVLNGLVEAWVSIKRVQQFLKLAELDLGQYYLSQHSTGGESAPEGGSTSPSQEDVLNIVEGHFTWSRPKEDAGSRNDETSEMKQADRNGENETLDDHSPTTVWTLTDLNLRMKPGQLVGVVGTVGSGKSSLLAAITAEMRRIHGQICIANLDDGFGLASQEAWIQHATVKDNILFGQVFDAEKYSAVVFACALEQDLRILPAGDLTEVGENGVTLSGGQKARLALARAVYQDKDIYLLDDPLAAVDAHVATHLFTHCIMGLLRHKTRILCTHHLRFLHSADSVVVMKGGRVSCIGPPGEVLPRVEEQLTGDLEKRPPGGKADVKAERGENKGAVENESPTLQESEANESTAGKQPSQEVEHVLVKEEEKEVGVVAVRVYWAFWLAVGNVLAPLILLSLFLMQASRNISDWWLAYWISHTNTGSQLVANISDYNITSSDSGAGGHFAYKNNQAGLEWGLTTYWGVNDSIPALPLSSASDNLAFYLGIYGALAAANSVFTLLRAFLYAYGGIEAATVLHRKLLHSILRAPVAFFDVTPIGRIVNRFSSDMYAIDDSLPFILNIFLAQSYGLLGTIAITCYGLPWFSLLLLPLGLLYYHIQKFYRRTSRELKRLSTVTLSPIYAHFQESLVGLCTIRALRASQRFISENEAKVDVNQRANFGSYAVARWLGIRLQMLGVAMVAGVAFIAVLEHHFNSVDPGLVGLAISYALSVTNLLSGVVTSFTETEKQMVSVERAVQYIQEAPTERDEGTMEPSLNWPDEGVVEFRRAVLIYREDLPPALNSVSFTTKPAEKIGVVGRTGAGKSSLFQALFRMVELTQGSILIDGIDIAALSLERLRSVLAVIPQDPFLFSGSVRENLDPCRVHSDPELWSVLERCHLRETVRELGGLGAEVEERGRVFSVGQRQLVCLARALLTQARVVCIDEATANVDLQTDAQIQQTIRSQFGNSTVITIAHRIETVLSSDRILVMERGQAREFGTPSELLDNTESLFSSLFREHCK